MTTRAFPAAAPRMIHGRATRRPPPRGDVDAQHRQPDRSRCSPSATRSRPPTGSVRCPLRGVRIRSRTRAADCSSIAPVVVSVSRR